MAGETITLDLLEIIQSPERGNAMSDVDKTKENIGITDLDEKTKKELFNKFVGSGGQVMEEKRRSGFKDFDRDKQKQYKQKIDTHKEKLQKSKSVPAPRAASASKSSRQKVQARTGGTADAASFGGIINRSIIRFRLLFMGVTDFWGGYYKTGFIEKFNTEYKTALLETQMIYLDLFKQNPAGGKAIIENLDSVKPLYYELIELISSIYDRAAFLRISQAFEEFPDLTQKISEYQDFFTDLFRKLYILRAYSTTILDSFERSINMQMKLEKNKAAVYTSKRKKIRNDIYIIFNKLFPRLYWLFCGYQAGIIPLNEPLMEELLGISADDKPGKRIRGAQPTEVEVPLPSGTAEKADEEKKNETLPDELRTGLEIMFGLDLKKLRAEYDKTNVFKFVKDNDKILIANLLLREFDREYSFILTTNKIKYNIIYGASGKTDYRILLSDMYNGLRDCIEALRQYAEILEAYEKARLDKPINNAQYIEYSKKLTLLEKNRKNIGHQGRMTVASFMDKVAVQLKLLLDDMNGAQSIVINPQELLAFDSEIEGSKKLSGKKVYESIHLTYCYASALAYRLSSGGDLAGEMELPENEQPAQTSLEEPASLASASPPPQAPAREKKATPAPETDKSVIEELDDLF